MRLAPRTLVYRREQRCIGAEQSEVVAIAFGGVECQAVAPHQLRQLHRRHHRPRKEPHEIALAERHGALHCKEHGEQRVQGLGHPECSKRLSTESTAAYIA